MGGIGRHRFQAQKFLTAVDRQSSTIELFIKKGSEKP